MKSIVQRVVSEPDPLCGGGLGGSGSETIQRVSLGDLPPAEGQLGTRWCWDNLAPLIDIIEALRSAKLSDPCMARAHNDLRYYTTITCTRQLVFGRFQPY